MDVNPFRVRGRGANNQGGRRPLEADQPRDQGNAGRLHHQGRGGGYGRGRGQARGRGQGRGQGRGHFRNGPNHQDPRHDEGLQDGPGARPRPQQRERPVRQPGYRMLESLMDEDKCPAEVVQELTSFGKGLESLLREREIRRDLMALLVRVLARVCECEDTPQSVVRVLNAIVDTDFLSRNLSQHINSMMTELDHEYMAQAPGQIASILKLMQTLIQRVRNTMKDVHVILTLIDVVARMLETRGYPLDGDSKVLLSQLLLCCQQSEQEKAHSRQRQQMDQEAPPPNDFREISIYPDVAEITTNADAYLRPNVVDGRYRDLNHYLDVQFRLLRQDFLEPLKLGIAEYHMSQEHTGMNRKLKDIRIYHDVGVHFPICTNEGITHRVSFDISTLGKVRWQATKRLTFGSLVCLSKDNFQSVIFATIANRKPEDLEQGLVDLRFQDVAHVSEIDSSYRFIMAESSAYFEAYRHVLQGLQEVRENSFPLKRYIIEVSDDVKPPEYLRNNSFSTYDLSPLMCMEVEYAGDEDNFLRGLRRLNTKASAVQVLTSSSWPRAETLHLDESQLRAVQAALTKELAIIQGPPGTGKTYIGLKIVRALLHNRDVWSEDDEPSPILVVCYTNHALDQFLEGILKFSQNIVRVGGRSNSEDMKNKNLNFLKREQRRKRDVQRAVHIRTGKILRDMYTLRQSMEVSQRKVERSMNGIISEDFLQTFMTKEHYASLTVTFPDPGYRRPTSCILGWLGLEGSFRVARGQEMGMAALMGQDEELEEEDQEEEDEEIAVAEEADAIAELRILDDEEDDMFLFDEAPQENHLVLDIDSLDEALPDQEGWQLQSHQKKRMRKVLLHNLRKSERMTGRDAGRVHNVWAVGDINSRWKLYRYWVSEYCKNEQRRMNIVQDRYENLSQELKEVRVEEDLSILRRARVIGMTTTGAAKHRIVLQRVGPKIVVVEEAAEVLESHIIATLSAECQHLILIGDHQQLRPNPTVYRLAKEYNLDISLFERMIKNGVPCQSLVQQHRMRPEISTVMRNHFYPDLRDHESVRSYPKVAGVGSDIFFLDHDIEEQQVDDSRSKSNTHEAEVLVGLCKYLIQQGQYQPAQITILTTYVGQLLNFKRCMSKSVFGGVRVCAVDNFQGEENDVILLSLVRSNQEGNIGFLKVSNRMCVALSRARQGFFCIGNFQGLAHGNTLWKNIVQEMRGRGLLGRHLSLVCHNHPRTITRIGTGQDFLNVLEGGCSLACEFRLDCGHSCAMLCHPTDPDHKEYLCLKKCEKVLRCGHRCKLSCFQTCDRCKERVNKTLPCGHQQKIPCHKNPDTVACVEQCTKRLPGCGHRCRRKCGEEPCTEKCVEVVFRSDWPCGHVLQARCSDGPESCPKRCGVVLKCSHECRGSCGACRMGRLHVQCREKCNRTLVCSHLCSALCTRQCPPCAEKCQNRCVHSKCPGRCGDPCAPCQEPCAWRCPHYQCRKKCSEACDRPPCDRPCPGRLGCGHLCIGLCGEPCPNKCGICHRDKVTEIFFGTEEEPDARFVQLEDCGHIFEVGGLDQWMRIKTEEQSSIQLKACPRCKTPIRRNLRYGSIINETLADIERVKMRIYGTKKETADKLIEVRALLLPLATDEHLVNAFTDRMSKPMGLAELTTVENQLHLVTGMAKVKEKATRAKRDVPNCITEIKSHAKHLSDLKLWLLKPRMYLSAQELEDCSREVQRLSMCFSFFLIKEKVRASAGHTASLQIVQDLLLSGKPLEDSSMKTVETILDTLKKECTGSGISDDERVMIVKAMGLSTGHWYKCPKGHCYAIGDCGGATVESRCPECQATIGGTSHRLASGNALAPEMDGARYSAYSEQAFMENYDPLELQNL